MLPLVTTHRLAPTANLASSRPAHEPLHGTQLQLFYEDAGISLEALLRERGKLPLAEAATILRQALQASARQQELDDARDAQLQEALRVSRREQGQVPHGSAVVVHRGAARAGYEI